MLSLRLSKTRLLKGLECEKKLYLTVHASELEAPVSAHQQAIFEQGTLVGIEAQKEFPFGVLIDEDYDRTTQAIRRTRQAMEEGALAIFEAAFEFEGITARVDILTRASLEAPWELIEVKSSTEKKPQHLPDIAIQLFILRGNGLNVSRAYLQHLNSKSTAPQLENLFLRVDVTAEVEALLLELPGRVQRMKQLLTVEEAPKKNIGSYCRSPYECGFISHCWKHVPQPSVLDFPDLRRKVWDFYSDGITLLTDERLGPFEGVQAKRLQSARTGVRWIDTEKVRQELSKWEWPIVYLDFETISYAIPRYPGTRPYQQIPFQFAINVQTERGGISQKYDFLHGEDSDPRPAILDPLCELLEKGKSVVAYYKSFEAARLEQLAEVATANQKKILLSAVDRLVDPYPVIKANIYDPEFLGSFSIKEVAPALLGKAASYEGMAVADGTAAQRAFVELTLPGITPRRKSELKAAMLAYCRKDTDLMQQLVDWLIQL